MSCHVMQAAAAPTVPKEKGFERSGNGVLSQLPPTPKLQPRRGALQVSGHINRLALKLNLFSLSSNLDQAQRQLPEIFGISM